MSSVTSTPSGPALTRQTGVWSAAARLGLSAMMNLPLAPQYTSASIESASDVTASQRSRSHGAVMATGLSLVAVTVNMASGSDFTIRFWIVTIVLPPLT